MCLKFENRPKHGPWVLRVSLSCLSLLQMRKSSRTLDYLVKVIKTMVSEHQSSHTFHYSVPLQVYTKDISSHIISEGIAKNFHHDSIICIIQIWVPRASLVLSYPVQQSLSHIYPRCATGGKIGTTDVGGVCFTHVLGTNDRDTTLLVQCEGQTHIA